MLLQVCLALLLQERVEADPGRGAANLNLSVRSYVSMWVECKQQERIWHACPRQSQSAWLLLAANLGDAEVHSSECCLKYTYPNCDREKPTQAATKKHVHTRAYLQVSVSSGVKQKRNAPGSVRADGNCSPVEVRRALTLRLTSGLYTFPECLLGRTAHWEGSPV